MKSKFNRLVDKKKIMLQAKRLPSVNRISRQLLDFDIREVEGEMRKEMKNE